MKREPFVTVCIPTFNCENTLSQTLDSLLGQKRKVDLIKIIDNHSTDATRRIVDNFKSRANSRIQLKINPKNIGADANIDLCVKSAEGDLTAIFHSDDVYSADMIKVQTDCFMKHPEILATFTHANLLDHNGKVKGERFLPPELSNGIQILDYKQLLKLTLKYGNFLTCPSAMVRTEVYRDQIKNYRHEEFKTSSDLDTWLRISKLGKIAFIPQPLMNYRDSAYSYSHRVKKIRRQPHDLFLVLDHYLSTRPDFLEYEDLENYKFLKIKDQTLLSMNSFRSTREIQKVSWPFSLTRSLRILSRSSFHLKFGLISLIYLGLCKTRSKLILKRLLK